MDLDRALVSALLSEGVVAVRLLKEKGVGLNLLAGDGKQALDFVLDYVSRYDQIPEISVVSARTGVVLDPPSGPAAFFIDEILNRSLHSRIRDSILRVGKRLEVTDPVGAYQTLEAEIREIRRERAVPSRVESLPNMLSEVLQNYEEVKAGKRGVLTPWPTINDITLGFQKKDLVLFVARLSTGKTWAMILIAGFSWLSGKRVLVATTEMGTLKMATRWTATYLKLPYKGLRSGTLDVFQEQKLRDAVANESGREGLYIVGGSFDFRIESFEAAIDECRPDIAILDGAYLLKTEGKDRIEKASNAFNELKRIAVRRDLPIVVSTQFNRDAKSNSPKTMRSENIALTDVAGWNADLIFGMVQTDDMKRDRRMRLLPLKFREGEGEEIELNWNIDAMDFSEIQKVAVGGTGLPVVTAPGPSPLGAGAVGAPAASGVPAAGGTAPAGPAADEFDTGFQPPGPGKNEEFPF